MDVERIKREACEIRKKAEAIHCHATRHTDLEAPDVMRWVYSDVTKLLLSLAKLEGFINYN